MEFRYTLILFFIVSLLAVSCSTSSRPEVVEPEIDLSEAVDNAVGEAISPVKSEVSDLTDRLESVSEVKSAVEEVETYKSAIDSGDIAALERLVSAGGSIDEVMDDGLVPLAYALVNGDDESILELIRLGADTSIELDLGTGVMGTVESALLLGRSDEVIGALIDSGEELDELCSDGFSLFEHAVDLKRPDVISMLALSGADIDIVDTVAGNTPLYYAVMKDDLEAASLLLDYGADPNAVNGQGYPLLFAVLYSGNGEALFDRMLRAGADIEARDMFGGTIDEYAASRLSPEDLDFVLSKLEMQNADIDLQNLIGFTLYGDADDKYRMVGVLLKHGLDLNGQTVDEGITPLMMAADTMDLDFVKKLVSMGARAEDRNFYGEDAFVYALMNDSNPKVATFIASLTGEIDDYRENGKTPLMDAATYALEPAIIEEMIKSGADVNREDIVDDEARCSAIHYAAIGNVNPFVIRLLVSSGADVCDEDAFGESALMLACIYNTNPEVVRTLIELGADVNRGRADTGDTPLMYAVQNETRAGEIVNILLSAGADDAVVNSYGETALSIATSIGAEDAVEALNEFGKR